MLAAVNLVDAGIPDIWAKALSPEHARILDRIGVHHVICPEADTGRRVAHLVSGQLQDYIEFDDGFAIVKMRPPQEAIGFTLEQSAIRSKYGVTIVGVKSPGEDFTYAVPSTKVSAHDTLIVSGPTDLIERLADASRSPPAGQRRRRCRRGRWPSGRAMAISSSPSSSETTRIGRRLSVGRKPKPLAKATARPLSVPTQ